MSTHQTCPECGKPLAEGTLKGLCPECMLKVGLAADSAPETCVGPGGTVVLGAPQGPPQGGPEEGRAFGRYRILRRLGQGGMGVVYEAEETDSGRRVALKVIHQKLGAPADRARFLREGRLAASVNHPNCVYVYGTEEIDGTPVISMEFVAGGTLQDRLAKHGPLTVPRAVDVVLQIIEGLEAAQEAGILHRDIKPSNCFENDEGLVKIGDFGLSISTLPRDPGHVTEAGLMVGTPAFCSPEQLRGEELSARSDMYAVGATLFHLLTGRLPFEGQTLPLLISQAIEKRAPSPQVYRKEIPTGLAREILRCLNKQPLERFRSYADLRRALEPYASTAPTPATLGLRILAGILDLAALSLLGLILGLGIFGDPFSMLERMIESPTWMMGFIVFWFSMAVSWYGISEWQRGATPGKALCGLRVLRLDRSFPRLPQALARAAIYTTVPVIPYWTVMLVTRDPLSYAGPTPGTYVLSLSYYAVLGLLFATARRRNGFAAVQDWLTGTRVVSRAVLERRPVLPFTEPSPAGVETRPIVGPYHVLESLGKAGEAEWMEGYDLRLLRRVLLRIVPPGTPPLPTPLQCVSRVGRLRWLSGRRDADGNWDAFEGVGGQPLPCLLEQPQPWGQVRFWLYDLAAELSAAERDGSTPAVLGLDRVWITREGRAKLLDLPTPGRLSGPGSDDAGPPPSPDNAPAAVPFLGNVAKMALQGRGNPGPPAVTGRMPLHARRLLESLPGLKGAQAIALALRPLLRRATEVTRLRRLAVVSACIVFPLMAGLGAFTGVAMMERWQRENPGLVELSQVLNLWRAKQSPFIPRGTLPDDRLIGTYVAAHYGAIITNEPIWSGAMARIFIPPDAREFARRSLQDYASPQAEELAEAEKVLTPLTKTSRTASLPPGPLFIPLMIWSALAIYVGIPAVIAALAFRGGLVLLAAGVTYVRRDGTQASRPRLLWRALLAWSPAFSAVLLSALALGLNSGWPALVGTVLAMILTAWSLCLPERSLPDRFAGTWPVPR
ncbi:MAG: protein kinase [Verrucomicrobiae bacterium]|nr:protein kinase [Verrucomicrobiae bacterium]